MVRGCGGSGGQWCGVLNLSVVMGVEGELWCGAVGGGGL